MNTKLILTLFLSSIGGLPARNPIGPPLTFPADPSAKVGADGQLYVYCSLDEKPDHYCSYSNVVLSTEDMKTWKFHPDSFVTLGKLDMLPANDAILYAPDCQYRDGQYYLYFCQPDKIPIGVATSKSPTGPFSDPSFLNVGKQLEIDPSTFIDDDVQAYHVWGQFNLKMAKLNKDMRTLDEGSIQDAVINEKEHHFHEGAYMTKHNGLYYLVYADVSSAATPSCLGYSTSTSPFGPYQYRGVIIDNAHCNPGNWNNHGSIVEFKGKWYVFYHRSSQGVVMMRRACVEPITFREDGSIPEVEMTTQGAEPPLDSSLQIEAEQACGLWGNVRVSTGGESTETLSGIENEDRVVYKYLDFKSPPTHLRMRVRAGKSDATINVHLDQNSSSKIAGIDIKGTPDGKWTEVVCDATAASGVHAVELNFEVNGDDGPLLDWWSFE
jgi:hypothetical protein